MRQFRECQLFLLIFASCLILSISCNTEVDDFDSYSSECATLEYNEQILQEEFESLQEMQQKIYNSTAKERIAFLQPFAVGQEIKVINPCVLSIRFEQGNKNSYKIAMSLNRFANKYNQFLVYLFNEKGILLSNSERLSYNKSLDVRGEIKIANFLNEPNTPVFFRLETVSK